MMEEFRPALHSSESLQELQSWKSGFLWTACGTYGLEINYLEDHIQLMAMSSSEVVE